MCLVSLGHSPFPVLLSSDPFYFVVHADFQACHLWTPRTTGLVFLVSYAPVVSVWCRPTEPCRDLEPLMHEWLVYRPLHVLTRNIFARNFLQCLSRTVCSVELRISLPVPQRLDIIIEMLSEEVDFGVYTLLLPMWWWNKTFELTTIGNIPISLQIFQSRYYNCEGD